MTVFVPGLSDPQVYPRPLVQDGDGQSVQTVLAALMKEPDGVFHTV